MQRVEPTNVFCFHMIFKQYQLYQNCAFATALSPPSDHLASIHFIHSQAAAAMTYKGTRLVHLLTGPVASARGSASVRSLSNESCEVTNLIDELLVLADNAIKVSGLCSWPRRLASRVSVGDPSVVLCLLLYFLSSCRLAKVQHSSQRPLRRSGGWWLRTRPVIWRSW